MKIKFHKTVYDLVSEFNQSDTHFQASFYIGENSIDDILEDTLNVETITVLEDDGKSIRGIFTGFTERIALYFLGETNDKISVEYENTDIKRLLNQLKDTVSTQESAIADLGEETNTLYENNSTQDLAIEDLAEAVDALTPEGE